MNQLVDDTGLPSGGHSWGDGGPKEMEKTCQTSPKNDTVFCTTIILLETIPVKYL